MPVDHYENFPVSSLLLPEALREPVAVVYRFARSADDFADEGDLTPQERLARLNGYREQLQRIERGIPPADRLFRDVSDLALRFGTPLSLFHDLLDAFSQDVVKTRYATFAELLDYCRRSANPVGRLLLHLFSATTPDNLSDSDSICTGLQLVNFWQDIAIDKTKGRIYLPQDDMARFGVTESQIGDQVCDVNWRNLLAVQMDRARSMLLAGAGLGERLPGRIGLEIRTTIQGGLRILEKLDAVHGDVFRHRPVLRVLDWPLILLRAL